MLAQKIRILLYIVVFETLVYAGNIGYDVFSDVHYFYIRHNATMQEVILQRTNKCDKWLGFGFSSFNLFLDAPIYYWFLQGHMDVFGEEMGIHPIEDLNALIEKYKPKMIYVDRVYERYDISEHQRVVHEPNMEMINKYYMPTEYASDNDGLEIDEETAQIRDKKLDFIRGLYILKPEYRQIKCMYDKEQNKWRYADE